MTTPKPGIRHVSRECPHCTNGRIREVDGASLREVRTHCGLSLRDVARQAGVSVPYLSDIERGNRRVTEKIAEVYGRLA